MFARKPCSGEIPPGLGFDCFFPMRTGMTIVDYPNLLVLCGVHVDRPGGHRLPKRAVSRRNCVFREDQDGALTYNYGLRRSERHDRISSWSSSKTTETSELGRSARVTHDAMFCVSTRTNITTDKHPGDAPRIDESSFPPMRSLIALRIVGAAVGHVFSPNLHPCLGPQWPRPFNCGSRISSSIENAVPELQQFWYEYLRHCVAPRSHLQFTCRSLPRQKGARSSRRRILPDGLRGRVSTNSTVFGAL